MKTKLSRIFGVAVTVAVLASMLVVATPASAGPLAFTSEASGATLPTGGVSITDMAVAGNGTTIYGVVTGDFSAPAPTSSGYSDLTFGTADHPAAAPVNNPIPDTSILGDQRLIKSTNTGASWSAVNTNPPGLWTSTIDMVAVAPDLPDGSYVVVTQNDNAGQKQMSVSADGGASWGSVFCLRSLVVQ